MSEEEFEAINGRQDWANWRTIARSMSGLVPDRPLNIIDLGCGSGGSTRVLAFYAPLGSRISGYELSLPLAKIARHRRYLHQSGRPALVEICCQGITEPLRDCFDHPLPDRSVDLVNASGVVGQHLSFAAAKQLLRELKRILVPGGLAMLDVGPRLSAEELSGLARLFGLTPLRYSRSSVFDRTGQLTFRNGSLAVVQRTSLRRSFV
jgi:SAM-dependent methyltransferase